MVGTQRATLLPETRPHRQRHGNLKRPDAPTIHASFAKCAITAASTVSFPGEGDERATSIAGIRIRPAQGHILR